MLSHIAKFQVLSITISLFVLGLGLNLCVAQSNGDIRVQFSPSTYEFISNESIDIEIHVQEFKANRWVDIRLRPAGFDVNDLSVDTGSIGSFRYHYSRLRFPMNPLPDFLKNVADKAYIRLTSPSSGSGNITLTVRHNGQDFTNGYSYINKDLEVILDEVPSGHLFESDSGTAYVHLQIKDRSNGKHYRVDKFDQSDIQVVILDNSDNFITDDKICQISSHVGYLSSGKLGNSSPIYEFALPAPRNLDITSGKIKISLKPGSMSGLADDDLDLTFTFNYSTPIVANADFVVVSPKQRYHRNGSVVLIGLYWDRRVSGVGTDDFDVEIDDTDDSVDNYVLSASQLIDKIYNYDETVPDLSFLFELTIPDSGTGRIRVFLKENACNKGNPKTRLTIFKSTESESYMEYGP